MLSSNGKIFSAMKHLSFLLSIISGLPSTLSKLHILYGHLQEVIRMEPPVSDQMQFVLDRPCYVSCENVCILY